MTIWFCVAQNEHDFSACLVYHEYDWRTSAGKEDEVLGKEHADRWQTKRELVFQEVKDLATATLPVKEGDKLSFNPLPEPNFAAGLKLVHLQI